MRREENMPEDGDPDRRKLEKLEGMQIPDGGGEGDVGDTDDCRTADVHVDSDWAKGSERKSTSEGTMQRHSGETLLENTSVACDEHGRSRVLHGHHRRRCGGGLGMQSMMTDFVGGSFSARVSRSSAEVRRVFVHHIVEQGDQRRWR